MRPVLKTNPQDAYKYPVDTTSMKKLTRSLWEIGKLTFTSGNVLRYYKIESNPGQVSVLLIILDLWKKARGENKVGFDNIVKTVGKRISEIYVLAAAPLKNQLGMFCSYCEQYYPGGLAVEHMAPKSQFPFFYLAWDNFLLACPSCNSKKGAKPGRADPVFAAVKKPYDDLDLFNCLRTSYLWPQLNSDAFRAVPMRLEYLDTSDHQYHPVRYPVHSTNRITFKNLATRVIEAHICVDPGPPVRSRFEQVRVTLNPTSDPGRRLVALVGLNTPSSNTSDGGVSDTRMWTRTLQWFKVLRILHLLQGATTKKEFDLLWQMMMMSVQQPGLYSVWVTVLDLLGPNKSWKVPGTTSSVMDRFLEQTLFDDYFPGTNITEVP